MNRVERARIEHYVAFMVRYASKQFGSRMGVPGSKKAKTNSETSPAMLGLGKGLTFMSNKSGAYGFVGYSLLILMIGTNLPTPLYSIYKHEWGFSSVTLTLVFAVYALMIIPSLLLFGQLSDRIGRKRVIIPGLLVSVLGSALFAGAHSVAVLFLARAIQGLSIGILSGAATAALAELHPRHDRRQAALIASVATAAGTALGPVISGAIAQYGPWPTRLPYIVHIILLIPGIIGLLGMPNEGAISQSGPWTPKRPSVPVEIRTPFIIGGATAFIAFAVSALFMSLVPSFVVTLMHVNNVAVAGGVVFVMLGSSTVMQLGARKLPSGVAMVLGLLLLVAGLALVVGAVPLREMTMLMIGTVVAGFGQGLAFLGSMVLVNQVAPQDRRADVISSFYVVIYAGVGIPVIGTGIVAQFTGLYDGVVLFAWVIGVVGILLAASIFIFARQTATRARNRTA